MLPSNNQFYETFDIGCAAYLLTEGFRIVNIRSAGGKRKEFIFPPEALHPATKYWNNEAKADPRELVNQLHALKTRIINS